jgi:hypothetical protein
MPREGGLESGFMAKDVVEDEGGVKGGNLPVRGMPYVDASLTSKIQTGDPLRSSIPFPTATTPSAFPRCYRFNRDLLNDSCYIAQSGTGRGNLDTLYSFGVFDLRSPDTITLPEIGGL